MTLTASATKTKSRKQTEKKISTDDKSTLPTKPVPAQITQQKKITAKGKKNTPALKTLGARSSSKKKRATSPAPVASASGAEEEENGERANDEMGAPSDSEEDNEHLHGFSTDDDDSSDEDTTAADNGLSPFEVSKLPTVAKDDATVKRKLEKAKAQPTEDRGVVYIGRLPHGFYEDQLRGYFTQFGDITRLRISRNKKTGKCKHYGFIEFSSSSVAQIVAETMDNYLLVGHILKCKLIPKDEVHPELWVGANRKWRTVPRDRIARVKHNKSRTEEEQKKATRRLLKRQNERKRKLEAAGIEYDFDAVRYKKAKDNMKT